MSRKKSPIDQKKLKKFGERLKSLRLSLNMSQRKFAKTIGISGNYISYLENGKSAPSRPILLAIKDQYLITPEQILTGKGFSLYNIKKYQSTKEELGPSTVHEYMDKESAPLDPMDQIIKGVTRLFNDQKKEIEKLHDMCEKVERRISDLEEQLRQSPPGEAGNHEDIIKKSAT